MVPVPGGPLGDYVDFIGWLIGNLPAYIGKFEVTNAQYQEFVDQGAYRKPEYWKEKFVKDGKDLTFDQAMNLLRDPQAAPARLPTRSNCPGPGIGGWPEERRRVLDKRCRHNGILEGNQHGYTARGPIGSRA